MLWTSVKHVHSMHQVCTDQSLLMFVLRLCKCHKLAILTMVIGNHSQYQNEIVKRLLVCLWMKFVFMIPIYNMFFVTGSRSSSTKTANLNGNIKSKNGQLKPLELILCILGPAATLPTKHSPFIKTYLCNRAVSLLLFWVYCFLNCQTFKLT
jgi:hypothetical protein